ncbi:C4-dicarboxylate ABC transporter permease [Kocuria coralli]|uniref:C4-dicarboxylate ABC transporter permease n=1 Tax=Kocuria coralli TaxID=1461025 RepID=A0A5J5L2G5_9MICC|nr:tripartite tricarboxylate transporter permease [Kocuria coralli]KAA9395405.1 C4-dicarboxylate ABC transporter permease [Kocuria coralli]
MENWAIGLEAVADPTVLLLIVAGVLIGIVVGALPGISATVGVAILLPFTFVMEPLQGMMLLLGIYGGAVYAGSIPAILVRAPGTPASAASVADGNALTRKGQAERALKISVLASCLGGIFGVIVLALMAPALASIALGFGPAAYFMLALLALTVVASVSEGRMVKGLISGVIGIGIAMIGLDTIQGFPRLTFGSADLTAGINYIPVMIGLFAVSEAFMQFESKAKLKLDVATEKFKASLKWLARISPSGLLGSVIGFIIGVIPGTGGDIGSFVAYNEAKRAARDKSKFGRGDERGLAAAEAAKNSGTAGAMVPMLTLGIPGDVTSAVLIGAITVHGLQPGPNLFSGAPDLVYGIFIGFLVVYLVLLILGWLGSGLWSKLIERVPSSYLWPSVIVLAVIGCYSLRSSAFDVLIMLISAVVGYVLAKAGFPLAPLIIGMILGPIAEAGFRRAMIIEGDLSWIFSPLPLVLLILTLLSVGFAIWREFAHHGSLSETIGMDNTVPPTGATPVVTADGPSGEQGAAGSVDSEKPAPSRSSGQSDS